jgi:secondary thiamine-phosphate synthase enzyme
VKVITEALEFNTRTHRAYLNVTPEVTRIVERSGVREGLCYVGSLHTTAAVFVNDDEEGLLADLDERLEALAPFNPEYRHHKTGETNGDSHLKSLLLHSQVIVPVTEGKLDLGTWQRIFYAEFDGRRRKGVRVKVIGE